ncbi:MAG: hypothetical protein M0R34_08010 [Candidatus Marinimicrobia bacterium]|nr:hypothetical protein [Candidatus Neomarinimicrobiota bacterium]
MKENSLMPINPKKFRLCLVLLLIAGISRAQFYDDFNKDKIEGWFFFTGDGNVSMDLVQMDGYARIRIDATKDKYNVWWTIIKRDISGFVDLRKLQDPAYELRVEAKVRLSAAPRRLNFMINTQRTTNFHEHLMEFDIPDISNWHVISYTTKNLNVRPGDTLYVQLDATDLGWDKYYVDIDYYRADVVNVKTAGLDKGEAVPYHPPIPDANTFSYHLNVAHDCLINSDFPGINFNDWRIKTPNGDANGFSVSGNQWAILKWDLRKFKGRKVDQAGLLELTTLALANGGNYCEVYGADFGMELGKIRVIEILSGDPEWDQEKVTYDNFTQGKTYAAVFNTQMIYDADLTVVSGGKFFITISKPVMQRLLDGTTRGLLIRPLGAIDAAFFASENKSGQEPKLHFNLKQ